MCMYVRVGTNKLSFGVARDQNTYINFPKILKTKFIKQKITLKKRNYI